MSNTSFSVKKTREIIRTVGKSKKFLVAIILTALASFARLVHSIITLSKEISSNNATTYTSVTSYILSPIFFIIVCITFFALLKTYLYYSERTEKSGLPLLVYTRIAELIFSQINIIINIISSFATISVPSVISDLFYNTFIVVFALFTLILNLIFTIPFIKAIRFAITIESGEPKARPSAACVFVLILMCVTSLIRMGKAPIFEVQTLLGTTFTDFWLLTLESGVYLSIYIFEFIAFILFLSIFVKVRASTLKPKKKYNKKCRF